MRCASAKPAAATRHLRRAAGFSLVELLTAVAVTSLMMFALLSMVGQSSTNYRVSQRKVSALADSRALFHFIENDLSSRVGDTKFFFRTNPANHSEFAFIRMRDAQESNATGDLAACVYYVAFSIDDANSGSPKLYRRTLDGPNTQRLLEAGNAAAFPATDPTIDEPIAYNIVRFGMRALRRAADGSWQPWIETSDTAPEQLEIIIDLTDDLSAQRLTQEAQWLGLANENNPQRRETVRRHTHRITLNP
jgi:hypothetical protein